MESKGFFFKRIPVVKVEQESLTDYYDARKKFIFNEMNLSKNENYILDLIKKSQSIAEKKMQRIQASFFGSTPRDVYNFSVTLKENIANYCLVISLYLKENKKLNALKLFLSMCEKNKEFIEILVIKILTSFPKMSNRNTIRLFYPPLAKITLQIISVHIKLAAKFNKFNLESFYIQKYLIIIYGIINANTYLNMYKKYEYGSNRYKFEKKCAYCNFLFDCSIYLFNRCRPLYLPISILQFILDIYNYYCKNESWLNENRLIYLLKVNYNLSLFYYTVGNNKEAINNLNKAKEILCKIKNFPVLNILKSDTYNLLPNNNRNDKNNFCEIGTNIKLINNINIENNSSDKQDKVFVNELNNFIKDNKNNINQYSTIYFGVDNIFLFRNHLKLEFIKENILKEIELNLAEIELKNKNYIESLNHINFIINSQANKFRNISLSNKDSLQDTDKKSNINDISQKFIYNLAERDKKRILHILDEIEKSNIENKSNISKHEEEIKNMIEICKKLIGKN